MNIINWMIQAPLAFFVFIIILVAGVSIQATEDFNPEELKEVLDNNYNNISKQFQIKEENSQITNIIYKILDTTIYTVFEASKIGVGWAYENREWINFKLVIWLFFLAVISCFVVPLTKLGIICFIISKEYFQNRKEKKELSNLRRNK